MFISIFVLILISLLWVLFPPNRVNDFYGYRTSFAMQNIQVWNEANRICARSLLICSLCTLIIASLIYWRHSDKSIDISTILILSSFIISIGVTELKIRKTYNKDGSKKVRIENNKRL